MSHAEIANIVLFSLLVASLLGWAATPVCTHPEVRAREREAKKRAEEAMRKIPQEELQHNFEHKGSGYKDGDPDRFFCHRDDCPRNRLPRP